MAEGCRWRLRVSTMLGCFVAGACSVRTEKELFPLRLVDDILVGHAEHLHDARQLLLLVLAWKDRHASVQLGEDAAETPHIDGHGVADAEDDLGRAVESGLDVRVDFLVSSRLNSLVCGTHPSPSRDSCFQNQ